MTTERDLIEWGQTQPAIGRCLHCPEFLAQGTAEEVRLAAEHHRQTQHPEIVYRKRSKRARANPAIVAFRQNLTEEEAAEVDIQRRRRMFQLGQTGE